jgi:hypothetical protein
LAKPVTRSRAHPVPQAWRRPVATHCRRLRSHARRLVHAAVSPGGQRLA